MQKELFLEKINIKLHFLTSVTFFNLNELSNLIHWKHFVDVFSLIIVIVTSRNIIFFVLMKKKTLNVSHVILHYVQILHNEPFTEIRGTGGSVSDWVSEKFHIETTWGFSWKNVSNCDYLPQFSTTWKIKYLYSLLHHKPPKFLNFSVSTSPLTKLDMFILKQHSFGKRKMSFSFDWGLLFPILQIGFWSSISYLHK